MTIEQTDSTIAAIDRALSDGEIDDLVDYQLSRYHERSGYDHDVNQPGPCGHCGRPEHGLAITRRIESMRWQGFYDEDYRYDTDDSEVLCPGSSTPGPVGFRNAWGHSDHVHWALSVGGEPFTLARGGYIRPYVSGSDSVQVMFTPGPLGEWVIPQPNMWARFQEVMDAAREAMQPLIENTNDVLSGLAQAVEGVWMHPATDLTARLFTNDGRPVPLRGIRVADCRPIDAGFRIDLTTPPSARRVIAEHGSIMGYRLTLDGPGGPRERITGTVVDAIYPHADDALRLELTSQHHRLPTVYTESEETARAR